MQTLSKIWNNFKSQPDIWFFYGFLVTFTLSIRKVLYFFPIDEHFNEYSGIYIYLSDIFLILTVASGAVFILYNRLHLMSIDKLKTWYVILPIFLVFWAFLSTLWSDNEKNALFRSIKILEFFLLYLYILFRFKNCSTPEAKKLFHMEQFLATGRAWNNLFKIIIFVAIAQSIIAIIQFVVQHSLGIFWLKESLISPDVLGVAKIIINNKPFIRSYGLFPHPNILGGFLMFSILTTIFYYDLFHVKQFFTAKKVWNKIILLIQVVALFLTFSKSAIFGLVLALFYLSMNIIPSTCAADMRGTIVAFTKKYLRIGILGLLVIILFLFMIKVDFQSLFIKSLSERNIYLNVSRETILQHAFIGSGFGQFVPQMQNYYKQILEFWQFQPVHNVFLLIWSELGIIGLIIFVSLILMILFHPRSKENVPCGTFCCYGTGVERSSILDREKGWLVNNCFKAALVGFSFIMLLDHYLWDIQQGQAMLWMVLGFIGGTNAIIDKKQ